MFNTIIDYDVILGLKNNISFIVTLVSYCIYKEWLLLSLDGKSRKECMNFNLYKSELLLRLEIFRKCNKFNLIELDQLESVINNV